LRWGHVPRVRGFALRQEGDDEQGILSSYRGTFSSIQGIKFDLTDGFIEAATPKDIKWVAKARWVVDGWVTLNVLCVLPIHVSFIAISGPALAVRQVRVLLLMLPTNTDSLDILFVFSDSDMVLAFIEHLVGPHTARVLRGAAEIRDATQDDPFAEFHGLV
jgi:hypothetical protein